MSTAQTIFFRIGLKLIRARYQILLGLIVACALPLLVRYVAYGPVLRSTTQVYATVGSVVAVVVGFYFFRRLTRYPGVESLSYVFPIFSITFALVGLFFLFFRVDYSRYVFASSYVLCQVWFHFIFFAMRRLMVPRFAIIPVGDAAQMRMVPNAYWNVLDGPRLADIPQNGIVTDLRADMSKEWETLIAEAALSGIPVYHFKQVKESLTGQVEIEHLSENTLGSLLPDGVYSVIKDFCDRLGALLLLPILLPFFALVALMIRLEGRGSIFYRQDRIGFRGRPFRVWKFRTMIEQEGDAMSRDTASTRPGDPRITRVGRLLRRTRIDELPQVFNILAGDMSWVGPRPEPAILSAWFETELPFYRYRHIVKPGITGWAQVNQGYAVGVEAILRKLHYDFYYIKNYSIWMDMLITVKTIRIIITGKGSR